MFQISRGSRPRKAGRLPPIFLADKGIYVTDDRDAGCLADAILEPDIHETIVRLADASAAEGALDARACALLRLAAAIGSGSEERIQIGAAEARTQGWEQGVIDQTAFLAFGIVGSTLGLKALELVRRPQQCASAAAAETGCTIESG